MNFYTYSAPGTAIPPKELGEDLCREDVWKEYVDCGFNMFMLTGDNGYNGEGWQESRTKKCFDFAKKLGIQRVIFDDNRIMSLIDLKDKLVGEQEDCRFSSEAELDTFIENCMVEYIQQENFYGLRLKDEPNLNYVKAYGEVYRSIKRVAKKLGKDYIYIQVNLLPLEGDYTFVLPGWEGSVAEAYEYYLDEYFKATCADIISIDNYPFRYSYTGGVFLLGYYICFQIFRKMCDKYNATMSFALQSFEMIHKTKPEATAGYRRITNMQEMMLQTDSALGFGVRDMSFYTYVTMKEPTLPYRSSDGSACITWKGKKTRIYEFVKAAIAHAKRLEDVLFAYDFKGAKLSVDAACSDECRTRYLGDALLTSHVGAKKGAIFDNSYCLRGAKKITHNRDIMLVTEFEKEGKNPYLIMVQNVLDFVYKTDMAPMHVRVDFDGYKTVNVFKNEQWEQVELVDGVYEADLVIGEAIYLIPKK